MTATEVPPKDSSIPTSRMLIKSDTSHEDLRRTLFFVSRNSYENVTLGELATDAAE